MPNTSAIITSVFAALGALVLNACRPPGLPAPMTFVASRKPMVREFVVREVQLEDRSLVIRLEIPLTPPGPKPAVIAFQENQTELLATGLVAVTYRVTDWSALGAPAASGAATPAGTVGKWVLASPSAGVLGKVYFELIAANAVQAIPRVLDYLATVSDIDPTRIGVVGASTKGFIALQAAAADERLAVAVVIQACGDYHRFLQFSSLGMEGAPLDLDPGYDAWLVRQEPIHHADRLVHAAVLLTSRADDLIIPIACAEETARALTVAYDGAAVPERFRFVRIDSGGHGFREAEGVEMMAWLARWLLRVP